MAAMAMPMRLRYGTRGSHDAILWKNITLNIPRKAGDCTKFTVISPLKVSLYREGLVVGDCETHPGKLLYVKTVYYDWWPSQTLRCDSSHLTVDSLMLTLETESSDNRCGLTVEEVIVGEWNKPDWAYLPATGLGLLGVSTILANIFVI